MQLFAEGHNRRQEEEWRQRISVAHMTAGLMRKKKLPALESLLPKKVARFTFTDPLERAAHTRLVMDQLASVFGGTITYEKRNKNG